MKTSISTVTDTKSKIEAIRGELTYTEILEYLLSLNDFRQELSGTMKVEIQLKKWLHIGFDKAITAHQLQRVTGCNLNTVKKILDLYTDEIEQHNLKHI